MRIRETRLPLSRVVSLVELSPESTEVFCPVYAPVYLRMEKNEKLITVKVPFDFFTPDELKKWGGEKKLYVSEFVHQVTPFLEAAKEVKQALSWNEWEGESMGPASFEISDAVLRILASLWSKIPKNSEEQVTEEVGSPSVQEQIGIENYFIAVFTNSFCEPLPSTWIQEARAQDIEGYERALARSGVLVFLTLHLGYLNQKFLDRLYRESFQYYLGLEKIDFRKTQEESISFLTFSPEILELIHGIAEFWSQTEDPIVQRVNEAILFGSTHSKKNMKEDEKSTQTRVFQKLKSRIQRIQKELFQEGKSFLSPLGEGGIYEL